MMSHRLCEIGLKLSPPLWDTSHPVLGLLLLTLRHEPLCNYTRALTRWMVSNIPKNKAENGIIGRWKFRAVGKGGWIYSVKSRDSRTRRGCFNMENILIMQNSIAPKKCYVLQAAINYLNIETCNDDCFWRTCNFNYTFLLRVESGWTVQGYELGSL